MASATTPDTMIARRHRPAGRVLAPRRRRRGPSPDRGPSLGAGALRITVGSFPGGRLIIPGPSHDWTNHGEPARSLSRLARRRRGGRGPDIRRGRRGSLAERGPRVRPPADRAVAGPLRPGPGPGPDPRAA